MYFSIVYHGQLEWFKIIYTKTDKSIKMKTKILYRRSIQLLFSTLLSMLGTKPFVLSNIVFDVQNIFSRDCLCNVILPLQWIYSVDHRLMLQVGLAHAHGLLDGKILHTHDMTKAVKYSTTGKDLKYPHI